MIRRYYRKLPLTACLMTALVHGSALAAAPEITIAQLDVVNEEDLAPRSRDVAAQQSNVPEDIFGANSGYVHPFLSLSSYHTDNVYLANEDTRSDWVGVLSPGIWFALPGRNQILLSLPSSNTQPAGLDLFLERPESFSRMQGYAFYGADLEYFNDYDDRDNTKQSGELFFQYNLRGGLSLNAYDKWIDSEEWRLTSGASSEISSYTSNLGGLVADYDMSEKVSLRLDYNNFDLAYDDEADFDKNRTDNGASLYGFYHYSPKTSLFVEYRYTDIAYETSDALNSDQNAIYGGMKWNPTISTKLIGKLGEVHKEFDSAAIDAVDRLGAELQLGHAFSDKANLSLVAAQKINETNVSSTTYQVKTSCSGQYSHNFTGKIAGLLGLGYDLNEYKGLSESVERDDDIYTFSTGLKYRFTDWLLAEALYKHNTRESTDTEFDYEENKYTLTLRGGI